MTIGEDVILWFNERVSDEEQDMFVFTKDLETLEFIVKNKPAKCRWIIISNTMNDSEILTRYPGIVQNTRTFGQNSIPCMMFADFENGTNIMNNDKLEFEASIEWRKEMRRYCTNLMFYRYRGPEINAGYWIMDENTSDRSNIYRYLSLSKWGRICQNVPHPPKNAMYTMNIIEMNDRMSNEWTTNLKSFIVKFFDLLLDESPDKADIVRTMSDDLAMETWIECFTHLTVNVAFNNEALEHRGDRCLLSEFTRYTYANFPRIGPGDASGFQTQYLSAKFQRHWAVDLSLFTRLLKFEGLRDNDKAHTDIFEAFIGAVDKIADRVSPGLNYTLVATIMYTISDTIPFSKSMRLGKSVHKVEQTNESYGFRRGSISIVKGAVMHDQQNGGELIRLTASVDPDLANFYARSDAERASQNPSGTLTNTLSSITTMVLDWQTSLEFLENATDRFWDKISSIYDINGLSIEKVKSEEDRVFRDLRQNHFEIYDQMRNAVKVFLGILEPIDNLSMIGFKDDKLKNYVILYAKPYLSNSGTAQSERTRVGERMDSSYQKPMPEQVHYVNLAVVPFFNDSRNAVYRGKKVTTLEKGKLNAIELFLSNHAV